MKKLHILILFLASLLACGPQGRPVEMVSAREAATGEAGQTAEPCGYMVLRAGQSNSLEAATFAGSSLSPWIAQPLVSYWHINAARGITGPYTLGPAGTKFGTELALGTQLAASGLPVEMSTVAIGSSQCPAALPAGPGYYTALMAAIDDMIAAEPSCDFPIPLNVPWDQGTTDAQASNRATSVYLGCLQSVASEVRSRAGWPARRVRFIVDKIQSQEPAAPSNANIRAAEDQFVAGDPDAVAINTDDLGTSDGYHYDPPGMVTLGEREAAASVGIP